MIFLLLFSSIKLLFFYSPDCPDCIEVEKDILSEIKVVKSVSVEFLSIKKPENMKLLMDIEEKHNDYNNTIPVVYVADSIFGNKAEIMKGLIPFLKTLKSTSTYGREEAKQIQSITLKNPVYIIYFYSAGCHKCSRMEYELKLLRSKFRGLKIEMKDVNKNGNLLYSIEKSIGIKKEKMLVTPVVILNKRIFFEKDMAKLMREILSVANMGGNTRFWELYRKRSVEDLIEKLKIPGIFFSGLIDGINPCAFGVLIFFIAFLLFRGKGREEILYGGISFITAVYLTYLLIGMGIFQIIRFLSVFIGVSKIIYILSGFFAIVVGILSLFDAFLYRKNKEMILKLPDRFRKIVRGRVRKNYSSMIILLAGFSIGFLVTIFEFTCTGQVYFPVITMIAQNPHLKLRALSMLIIYNIGFIAPSIGVFLLAFLGIEQRQFNTFLTRNVIYIKVLTGLLLLTIGAIVLLYIH